MNSIGRMKAICVALGCTGHETSVAGGITVIDNARFYPSHKLLDECDALAGVDTTGGRADGLRGNAAHLFPTPGHNNQVGTRLALLEQHLFTRKHECEHHLNIMAQDGVLQTEHGALEERDKVVRYLKMRSKQIADNPANTMRILSNAFANLALDIEEGEHNRV